MRPIIRIACLPLAFLLLVSCADPQIEWLPVQESDHFKFFAAQGAEDAAEPLARELEANYERITRDLQVAPADKFEVYLFADVDSFHRASGRPDAPATSIGTTQGTDIWLVSPLNPSGGLDTQEMLAAGVHEFVHALVHSINGSLDRNNYNIPIWLSEGLAGYEAGQMIPEWRARMRELVAQDAIPSIGNDLVPDRYDKVKGFPFSITLVEYILDEYGMEKVIAMLKSPSEVEAILGVSLSELDAGWRAYLHRTYQ